MNAVQWWAVRNAVGARLVERHPTWTVRQIGEEAKAFMDAIEAELAAIGQPVRIP